MPGFIKFDGLDGECKEQGYEGWSVIEDFNQTITNAAFDEHPEEDENGSFLQEGTGAGEVTVTMELDRLYPKLMAAAAEPKDVPRSKRKNFFKSIKVHVCTREDDDPGVDPYLMIEMRNAHIKSYNISASANDDESLPTGTVTLGFEEIRWEYLILDAYGHVVGRTYRNWSPPLPNDPLGLQNLFAGEN